MPAVPPATAASGVDAAAAAGTGARVFNPSAVHAALAAAGSTQVPPATLVTQHQHQHQQGHPLALAASANDRHSSWGESTDTATAQHVTAPGVPAQDAQVNDRELAARAIFNPSVAPVADAGVARAPSKDSQANTSVPSHMSSLESYAPVPPKSIEEMHATAHMHATAAATAAAAAQALAHMHATAAAAQAQQQAPLSNALQRAAENVQNVNLLNHIRAPPVNLNNFGALKNLKPGVEEIFPFQVSEWGNIGKKEGFPESNLYCTEVGGARWDCLAIFMGAQLGHFAFPLSRRCKHTCVTCQNHGASVPTDQKGRPRDILDILMDELDIDPRKCLDDANKLREIKNNCYLIAEFGRECHPFVVSYC